MASVTDGGLVTAKELTGVVAVMARFQAHVAVFRATLPLGQAIATLPPAKTFIDERVFDHLKKLGLPVKGVYCPPFGVGHMCVVSTEVPFVNFARRVAHDTADRATGRGRTARATV